MRADGPFPNSWHEHTAASIAQGRHDDHAVAQQPMARPVRSTGRPHPARQGSLILRLGCAVAVRLLADRAEHGRRAGTWSRSVPPGALLANDSVGATIRAMDTPDTHVRHLPEGAAVIFPASTEEAATVLARIGGYGPAQPQRPCPPRCHCAGLGRRRRAGSSQVAGDSCGGHMRRDRSIGLIRPTSLPSGSATIA